MTAACFCVPLVPPVLLCVTILTLRRLHVWWRFFFHAWDSVRYSHEEPVAVRSARQHDRIGKYFPLGCMNNVFHNSRFTAVRTPQVLWCPTIYGNTVHDAVWVFFASAKCPRCRCTSCVWSKCGEIGAQTWRGGTVRWCLIFDVILVCVAEMERPSRAR